MIPTTTMSSTSFASSSSSRRGVPSLGASARASTSGRRPVVEARAVSCRQRRSNGGAAAVVLPLTTSSTSASSSMVPRRRAAARRGGFSSSVVAHVRFCLCFCVPLPATLSSRPDLGIGLRGRIEEEREKHGASCVDIRPNDGDGIGKQTHTFEAGREGEGDRYAKTAKKALAVNLNPLWYGTFAEIGAGQEVARWFFRVGAAAGTIAKSVSAYDMLISDTMYGAAARYVTRERVEAMLEYEYLSCSLNLRKQRGKNTAFFAFADTVVARAFGKKNECHGWLGVKFQPRPGDAPSTVMIHVRMFDATAQEQQEALGVLGVNLIHSVLTTGAEQAERMSEQNHNHHHNNHHHHNKKKRSNDVSGRIISSLLDDLSRSRIEVDLIDFSGPLYDGFVDNRVAALRLVQKELCDAALFDPSGTLLVPHEALYKKNVLAVRGRFRPFTNLHNDMLIAAAEQFFCGKPAKNGASASKSSALSPNSSFEAGSQQPYERECVYRDDTVVLLEMTTRDMMEGGDLLDWTSDSGIREDVFIQRVEALSTMGYTVMISNYRRYFKLAAYLSTFTQEGIVIAMGVPTLRELFKEKHYSDLDGGLLEGFGRLLKFDLKIFVYPTIEPSTGKLVTAADLKVDDPNVQKLYDYILERGAIVPVEHYDRELLRHGDVSKLVAESIRSGTGEWEALVPHHVRDQVKRLNLLGYRGSRDEESEGGGGSGSGSGSSGESDGGGAKTTGAGSRKQVAVAGGNGSGSNKPRDAAKAAPAA